MRWTVWERKLVFVGSILVIGVGLAAGNEAWRVDLRRRECCRVGRGRCCIGRRGRRRLVVWSGMLAVTEDEGLGGNVHFSHDVGSFFGFLAFYLAFVLVLLQSCIALSDYSLYLRRGQ